MPEGRFRERRLLKVLSVWEAALGFGNEQAIADAHAGKSVPRAQAAANAIHLGEP